MNKMKRGILVFVLMGIILSVVLVSSAGGGKVSKDVYESLEKNDKTRVIVKINDSQEELGGFRLMSTDKRSKKEEVIERIKEKGRKYKNFISVEVSKSELNELEKNNKIEEISSSHSFQAFLQNSVPHINATSVWPMQLSGENITGTDESVCVLDTGIDFSHPDLQGRNKTCNIDCYNKECVEDCSVSDDNGHGTHVAGIVGASGGIEGVATNTGLIGVKVLNSEGSSSPTAGVDLANAIDWCVTHKEEYNISVISMSLGDCTNYSSPCDEDYSIWAEPINNATAHNISVIASAGNGNSGECTGITPTIGPSSPACIENVTAVGGIYDSDDSIIAEFQRGSLFELMAPGYEINSTKYGGGYISYSGTSMAAPHVAGAVALLRQFYRLQSGRELLSSEIESTLNNTGKRINDSETGLNFSRINVYSAILSLDETSPNVSLINPENDSSQFSQNVSFNCSAEDWQLKNVSLQVWNSSGSLVNTSSENITGESNYSEFNLSLDYGDYEWNCLVYDEENNSAFASLNNTFEIKSVEVILNYPINNSYVNENKTFNCSSETEPSKELTNTTFYLWNSSDLVYNKTKNLSGQVNSSLFEYNLSNEGEYKWTCQAWNNESENYTASNYTITYDATNPNLNVLSSPGDETLSSSGGSVPKSFSYNVSDTNLANCSLIIDGGINMTNSGINQSVTQNFTQSFSSGSYTWAVNCSDFAGNINSSGGSFTISEPEPSDDEGDNGGSPSISATTSVEDENENEIPQLEDTEDEDEPKTYSVGSSEASSGYTKSLKEKDKVKFKFDNKTKFYDGEGEEHVLIVNEIKNDSVNLTIKSNPIHLVLGIGQSAKLNLTSKEYYDLYIKLNSIINGSAEITLQIIHEPIKDKNNLEVIRLKIIIVSLILIFIIAAIVILWKERKNLPINKKTIEEYKKKFREHLHPDGNNKKDKEGKSKKNEKDKKGKKGKKNKKS